MRYIPLSEFFRVKINSFNWDKLCVSTNEKKLSMVSDKLCKYLKMFLNFFYSRTVHPDIIKSFIYPTECTTKLKFTLKFYVNP